MSEPRLAGLRSYSSLLERLYIQVVASLRMISKGKCIHRQA